MLIALSGSASLGRRIGLVVWSTILRNIHPARDGPGANLDDGRGVRVATWWICATWEVEMRD